MGKQKDEFSMNRMLDELPSQRPTENLRRRLDLLKDQDIGKTALLSGVIQNSRRWWVSIAASVIMFASGYMISNGISNSRFESLVEQNMAIRNSLIQRLPLGDDPNGQISSLKVLSGSSSETTYPLELIDIYKELVHENVKLAVLQELESFADEEVVAEFLLSELDREESPLIMIPIISLLSRSGAQKGKNQLKQIIENRRGLHPAILNHLKTIEQ